MVNRPVIDDFSKGLLQAANPVLLANGYATALDGLNCHKAPLLAARRGRTAIGGEITDTATYLGQFRTQDGGYYLVRGIGSTGMLQYWGGSGWHDIGQMTPTMPVYSVVFPEHDYIIFADGFLMKKWVLALPVHYGNDSENAVTSIDASELSTLKTLLNEVKAAYEAHRASAVYHETDDMQNKINSSDASDLETALTLVNELKQKLGLHFLQEGCHINDDHRWTILSQEAYELEAALTLANEIKRKYNLHLANDAVFVDLEGSPPKLIYLEVYLNKVWGVRNLTEIRFSTTGNPEDWETQDDSGDLEVNTATGDPITAIRSYRGKLYIWTQNSMHVLLGDGPWNFTRVEVHPTAGCISHLSVAEAGEFLYWYGSGGIWEYYPGTVPRLISLGQIDDVIESVDTGGVIAAGTDGIQYRVSLPGISGSREVIFDTRYRSWWLNENEAYSRYLTWRRP
jgi:hypothetical protein